MFELTKIQNTKFQIYQKLQVQICILYDQKSRRLVKNGGGVRLLRALTASHL